MRELKLLDKHKKKGYKSYRGTVGKSAANVVSRNFKTNDNNKKWVTDSNLIIHSDQGFHYKSNVHVNKLKETNIV